MFLSNACLKFCSCVLSSIVFLLLFQQVPRSKTLKSIHGLLAVPSKFGFTEMVKFRYDKTFKIPSFRFRISSAYVDVLLTTIQNLQFLLLVFLIA